MFGTQTRTVAYVSTDRRAVEQVTHEALFLADEHGLRVVSVTVSEDRTRQEVKVKGRAKPMTAYLTALHTRRVADGFTPHVAAA